MNALDAPTLFDWPSDLDDAPDLGVPEPPGDELAEARDSEAESASCPACDGSEPACRVCGGSGERREAA